MPYVSAFDDHCDIALFCWHRVQQQRMRSGQRSVYKLNWRIVGVARWNREKTKRAVIAIKSLRFNCNVSSSLSISLTVTPNAQFWSRKVSIAIFPLPYQFQWRSLQVLKFKVTGFNSCPFFPINFHDVHSSSSIKKEQILIAMSFIPINFHDVHFLFPRRRKQQCLRRDTGEQKKLKEKPQKYKRHMGKTFWGCQGWTERRDAAYSVHCKRFNWRKDAQRHSKCSKSWWWCRRITGSGFWRMWI